jgi:hypothetical protein
MALDPIFIYANYAEAGLWVILAIAAFSKRTGTASIILSISLLFFGLSDLAETRTGGWYKPWWLLTWKSACVLLILTSGLITLREHRQLSNQAK